MDKNKLFFKLQLLLLTIMIAISLCFVVFIGSWSSEKTATSLDFRKVIKSAKARVFPSVVFIKSLRKSHEQGKENLMAVVGSGVLISSDGKLLTNWHVVENSNNLKCLLYNGKGYDAEIIGSDKDTDLALVKLKLNPNEKVNFSSLASSKNIKEGDFVMAMGAPWGLSRSVSLGIISCKNRYLPQNSQYSLWLQTDAAISPGNSGGPLINTDGKIIGINTRGVMFGGNMGFSIPSGTIKKIIPQLEKFGKVNWSYTGLQLQPLKDFNKNIFFDATEGVIVAGIDSDSPAKDSLLQARDRILEIDGKAVTATTFEDLPKIRTILGSLSKNKKVLIKFIRNGKKMELFLTPREKGRVKGKELNCPRWDFTVKTINKFENPALHFYQKKGVFVYGIRRPGNAAECGLLRKDIILKINGNDIKSLKDIETIHKKIMKDNKTKRIVLLILRDGFQRQAVLDYSRDYEKF